MCAAMATLFIGNKNYSSWSMRPWLALRWGAIAFDENVIPLGGPHYGKSRIPEILAISPSGRVPALRVDDVTLYDSLAICEWAAEQAPSLWPRDPRTRALARAAAAEMHAGFAALRRDLAMNVRRRLAKAPDLPADTQGDLARLFELWGGLRARYAEVGPWLFGARSIADAMFAPVATRLRTYAIDTPAAVESYCATLFADADFRDWEAGAEAETWTIEHAESLYR
jgi:glutathione S-transferase